MHRASIKGVQYKASLGGKVDQQTILQKSENWPYKMVSAQTRISPKDWDTWNSWDSELLTDHTIPARNVNLVLITPTKKKKRKEKEKLSSCWFTVRTDPKMIINDNRLTNAWVLPENGKKLWNMRASVLLIIVVLSLELSFRACRKDWRKCISVGKSKPPKLKYCVDLQENSEDFWRPGETCYQFVFNEDLTVKVNTDVKKNHKMWINNDKNNNNNNKMKQKIVIRNHIINECSKLAQK